MRKGKVGFRKHGTRQAYARAKCRCLRCKRWKSKENRRAYERSKR